MAIKEINEPLQASGCMDYESFVSTLKYLLDASWGPKWGRLTPDGPNMADVNNVEYPIILYYINEMRPGKIGKSTQEIRPRHRHSFLNTEANGDYPPQSSIYGQVFDAEIVFEVWEETNAKVDKMAKQFRQTLATYAGFLKGKGLKEIQFLKMVPNYESTLRDAHKVRALSYFVKFEELMEVPTDIYRVIEVVDKQLQEETKIGE